MQYMTSRQKAAEWSVTRRMVNYWCANGEIEGAYKEGSRWLIPVDVERPGEEERLRRMRAYTIRITGRKIVGVGIQDFEALRRDQMFYVDKTDFIRQWWESGETTTLITRPRRFGKTLNLSMLNCFFSTFYENRADLFEGLKIWDEKSYHKLQGRFPVIFLSFAGVKGKSFESVFRQMNYGIVEIYRRFERILDMSQFTDKERQDFERISWDMDTSVAAQSLRLLTDLLYTYYGQKPIILLDEYDTPMQEAYLYGYWKEFTAFIRSLFNATFKTNPYLERAMMTGITRVSKESVFSDLNNLNVVTTTSTEYETCFGFSEEEVFQALEERGMNNQKKLVKSWYDGFIFGNTHDIYNPWSITNFLDKKQVRPYWADTSSNSMIDELIRKASTDIKEKMEELLQGKEIVVNFDEQIVFEQLDQDENAIWSLMLVSGYLKAEQIEYRGVLLEPWYHLRITNLETTAMFTTMFKGWFAKNQSNYNQFMKALLSDDIDAMNYYMNQIIMTTFSYFDVGQNEPERFYHGFVLGLIADQTDIYEIRSNRESGFGRYDVMMIPKIKETKKYPAIIMEFKVRNIKREESLEDTVQTALTQIKENVMMRNYMTEV